MSADQAQQPPTAAHDTEPGSVFRALGRLEIDRQSHKFTVDFGWGRPGLVQRPARVPHAVACENSGVGRPWATAAGRLGRRGARLLDRLMSCLRRVVGAENGADEHVERLSIRQRRVPPRNRAGHPRSHCLTSRVSYLAQSSKAQPANESPTNDQESPTNIR